MILLIFLIKVISVCCLNKRVTGKFKSVRAEADHRDRNIEELERHQRQLTALLQRQLDHDYAEVDEPPVVERRALLTGGPRPEPVPRVRFIRDLDNQVDSASYVPAAIHAEVREERAESEGEDETRV